MTYSAFINAILANIESQESKRTYMSSEYIIHFEYEPKKDSVWIMGVNDQLFSSHAERCIEVCSTTPEEVDDFLIYLSDRWEDNGT